MSSPTIAAIWQNEEAVEAHSDALDTLEQRITGDAGRDIAIVIPAPLARTVIYTLANYIGIYKTRKRARQWIIANIRRLENQTEARAIPIPEPVRPEILLGLMRPGIRREIGDWLSAELDALDLDPLTRDRFHRIMGRDIPRECYCGQCHKEANR